MSTLEIKNLHVQVETNDGPKQILRGVNLTVGSNEVHAIMGPTAQVSPPWLTPLPVTPPMRLPKVKYYSTAKTCWR